MFFRRLRVRKALIIDRSAEELGYGGLGYGYSGAGYIEGGVRLA